MPQFIYLLNGDHCQFSGTHSEFGEWIAKLGKAESCLEVIDILPSAPEKPEETTPCGFCGSPETYEAYGLDQSCRMRFCKTCPRVEALEW